MKYEEGNKTFLHPNVNIYLYVYMYIHINIYLIKALLKCIYPVILAGFWNYHSFYSGHTL